LLRLPGDHGHDSSDGYDVALGGADLAEDPGIDRLDFHVGLVGLHFGE
jgi:hypothetical protein